VIDKHLRVLSRTVSGFGAQAAASYAAVGHGVFDEGNQAFER
jgi:hypothetical protein